MQSGGTTHGGVVFLDDERAAPGSAASARAADHRRLVHADCGAEIGVSAVRAAAGVAAERGQATLGIDAGGSAASDLQADQVGRIAWRGVAVGAGVLGVERGGERRRIGPAGSRPARQARRPGRNSAVRPVAANVIAAGCTPSASRQRARLFLQNCPARR